MLQREEAIRRKSPRMVAQELWAIGLAYNLVRLEMTRIAREAGGAPIRLATTTTANLPTSRENQDEQLPAKPPVGGR